MASDRGVIGIHFVPADGHHWAEFLQQKLCEDGYNIKSMLLDLTSAKHTHFFETNIILVSPEFFSLQNLGVLRVIDPRNALLVLLGTESKDLRTFLIKNKFSDMLNFITFFETVATENCVRELLIGIIKLYEHVNENSDEESEAYDTLPPPRESPISNKEHNNIYKVALSWTEENREVFILCDRKGNDEIQIDLQNKNGHIKAIHENKVIYKFSIDKSAASENLQFVARDGDVTLGRGQVVVPRPESSRVDVEEKKTQSKLELLQEILGNEDDPICLICRALNLKERTREALDANLAKKCQCLEPLRKLEGTFFDNINGQETGHSGELWPTLLHFSAEFNLPHFCEELLKLPWSMDTCLKLNRDNETPLDIAKRNKSHDVAKQIQQFTDNQIRSGNVPGNKDSGVVEDDDQPQEVEQPIFRCDESYQDMSQLDTGRDSLTSVGADDEDEEDLPPPPSPHPSKTYVNISSGDIPPSCNISDPPPPPPHARSLPTMSGESDIDSSNDYMEMTGKDAPIRPCEYALNDPSHRSKSEGDNQTAGYDEDDEDYEIPEDPTDFDLQSTGSQRSSIAENVLSLPPMPIHDIIQLPTHAHPERQSGFFKKFKLFGKPKKNKDCNQGKARDRKMSMPTESDLKTFQKTTAFQKLRRGSVQHVQPQRESTSSNSSVEMQLGLHKDDKAKSTDKLNSHEFREKKKHFLHKDARKSIRIKTALSDQINPLPLPSRSQKR